MFARTTLLLAGLAVLVLCDQTRAQAQRPDISDRYLSLRVSRCFLSRGTKFVEKLLVTLPGSTQERLVLNRNIVDIDSCFGINSDGSRFQHLYDFGQMRAGIVRALLLSRRDMLTEQPPAGLSRNNWYSINVKEAPEPNAEAVLANDIGFCLAKKNWVGVRALVLAVDPKMEKREPIPKSAREREARVVDTELRNMVAMMQECVPAGLKVRLNLVRLRNLLEETVLHAIDGNARAMTATQIVQWIDHAQA